MASPAYSTAHQWEDPASAPGSPYYKVGLVGAALDAAYPEIGSHVSKALQAGSSASAASAATTRCGTPSTRAATPHQTLERGGRGQPGKRPTVDLKSRFCTSTASLRLNQSEVDLRALAQHIPGGNCIYRSETRTKAVREGLDMAKLQLSVERRRTGGARFVHIHIFRNGYVRIIGAKSYGEVLRTARRLVEKIKHSSGVDSGGKLRCAVKTPADLEIGDLDGSDENGISWSNLRFDFDLGFNLKLDNVTEVLGKFFPVSYEPELNGFHAVSVKASPSATVCFYGSGKGFVIVSKDTGHRNPASKPDAGDAAGDAATKGMLDAELEDAYNKVCELLWLNLKCVVNLSARPASRRR